MPSFLYVAAGGAMGAVLRYVLGDLVTRMVGQGFPWGTLMINILGSFLMGVVVAGWNKMPSLPPEGYLFLAVGILGGFTTFSTFSLEAVQLWEQGNVAACFIYVMASVLVSILALMGAMLWVRSVL
ncbi:MAG: fluoride efflux transporter CrcB [Alphaproteobacteria bacterium]|nr:fluoride efflux transporter CrcB [Alphaproteobacteria bacterium]